MRISDWSSDVCSSDLGDRHPAKEQYVAVGGDAGRGRRADRYRTSARRVRRHAGREARRPDDAHLPIGGKRPAGPAGIAKDAAAHPVDRHTHTALVFFDARTRGTRSWRGRGGAKVWKKVGG